MGHTHLFEFMDLTWLPSGLHATLREILECGNARPLRPYYEWVANEVKPELAASGCHTVVELGAGSAPITRLLARDRNLDGVQLIVCDLQPDTATYGDLEKRYPGRVVARRDPVDFAKPQQWPANTLLLLSGTFHHIPPDQRVSVLQSLTKSGDRVMICEPLRRKILSMVFVIFSIVPALVLPLWFIARPGKMRRFFWCWLLPLAPIMFWWDGFASCVRMWTDKQWQDNLREVVPEHRTPRISHSLFSQMVAW